MNVAITIVGIAVVVVVVSAAASRFRLSPPLVLLLVGIAIAFVPQIHDIRLTSDIVLLGLLPPLLYAAAIRTSVIDFRTNIRAISSLSIALVVITALAVGLVGWLLLPPSVPFAAAFALGAVVAPPDAVAATSIARRVGLPRRMVTILEGESLLNDATAITCLRVGLLALSATVGVGDVATAFLVALLGGALVGAAIAGVVVVVRRRISDPILDTAISLIVPFAAYLPAEEFVHIGGAHGSGVIAVVIAALILGHYAPIVQTAQSRLNERINWRTISFLLENAVFLLIGLQTKNIVTDAARSPLGFGRTLLLTLAVLGTVVVVRLSWLAGQRFVLFKRRGDDVLRTPWGASLVLGWAGMRGVVTLAIAFLLPLDTPERASLIFCALGVTAGTLLLQGTSLPWLARRVGLRGPNARQDALAMATVLEAAGRAALTRLEDVRRPTDSAETLERLRDRIASRPNGIWERLGASNEVETPSEEYRRLRLATLQAERDEVLHIRRNGTVDSDVLEAVLTSFDVEESMLTAIDSRWEQAREDNLEVPAGIRRTCDHLDDAPHEIAVDGPGTCLDCEREGTRPVHLRICLTCGNVGCCDSSVGRHAKRHFEARLHPVMRSFELGENWRWCYVDQQLG
ncbi:MAG: Na+/H+ antiporter [Propionibacteriaceae bacterium]